MLIGKQSSELGEQKPRGASDQEGGFLQQQHWAVSLQCAWVGRSLRTAEKRDDGRATLLAQL